MRDELCNSFFRHVAISILTYQLDSDESYHSESEFYYPDEMTNDNEKGNMGAINNQEDQQNVDVFTMVNVQKYILAQRAENTVKKKKSTT